VPLATVAGHFRWPLSTYRLGDVARTPHDMVVRRTDGDAVRSAALLRRDDRAFLKRSNGLW
jgi:hypothetical protein